MGTQFLKIDTLIKIFKRGFSKYLLLLEHNEIFWELNNSNVSQYFEIDDCSESTDRLKLKLTFHYHHPVYEIKGHGRS